MALPSELRRGGGKYCTVDCYRKSQLGRVFTKETKQKISKANTGKKHTQETKEKLRNFMLGQDRGGFKRHCVTCGTAFRCNPSDSTINCSKDCSSQYVSETRSGKNSPSWQGGLTPKHLLQRRGLAYKNWRTSVFVRDNYTCQTCGQIGGKLQADHILPFSIHKDLRFSVSNGQTLCIDCHLVKTKADRKYIHKVKTNNL